jgi:hypothetical protein
MQAYKTMSNNILKQHCLLAIVTKFGIDDNYTILGSHRAFCLLRATHQYCLMSELSDTVFTSLVKISSNFSGMNMHKSCNPSEACAGYQLFLKSKYYKITVLEVNVKENHGLLKKRYRVQFLKLQNVALLAILWFLKPQNLLHPNTSMISKINDFLINCSFILKILCIQTWF